MSRLGHVEKGRLPDATASAMADLAPPLMPLTPSTLSSGAAAAAGSRAPTAPVDTGLASESFTMFGVEHEIVVTEPHVLPEAVGVAQEHLRRLESAASRFRADSELSQIVSAAAQQDLTTTVSPFLASYLAAALRTAELTGGLVDPLAARMRPASSQRPDVRAIGLNAETGSLTLPQGVELDVGGSAKAHAADTIAAELAGRLPGGFAVDVGGDIAVTGRPPRDGWHVGIEAADGSIAQVIGVTDQAVSTSFRSGGSYPGGDGTQREPVVDPRTGAAAITPWAQVSCVGPSALEASAASRAAVILGDTATHWLATQGIPARLDRAQLAKIPLGTRSAATALVLRIVDTGAFVYCAGWPHPTYGDSERSVDDAERTA